MTGKRKGPKYSRQQLLTDLKKLSDAGELLNSNLTRIIDESTEVDFVEVIDILKGQLKFIRYDQRTQHGPLREQRGRSGK